MLMNKDQLADENVKIDFRKSPYLELAHSAKGFLGTYMVALAAFQRGLQVSFLYDAEHVKTSSNEDSVEGEMQVGRSFAVSNGSKVYRFNSSSGIMTSEFAKKVTYRKDSQKKLYLENHIPVPLGKLSNKTSVSNDLKNMVTEGNVKSFVIKPFNGSLARDTYVDKSYDEILEIASNFPSEEFMIEEFISGPEYRFTVVNNKCVGVFERKPPHVIGDGKKTIEQLIEEKNQVRLKNPFLKSKLIDLTKYYECELQRNEVGNLIPDAGEEYILCDLQQVGVGGETWDVMEEMPTCFKEIAIKVCNIINAGNAGIDIIISSLDDVNSARVLEANIRHHIEGHTFAENKEVWDNDIAEALIDMYFPETIENQRSSVAVFDHRIVRKALQFQAFSALHLPKIDNDWVSWHFYMGNTQLHGSLKKSIMPEIAKFGMFCCETNIDQNHQCLSISGNAVSFEKFLATTEILKSLKLIEEIGSVDT
jgi:cyanophycin synthetase